MTSKNWELVVVSNTPGWVLEHIKSRFTSGTEPLCDVKQETKLSWACFPNSVIEEIITGGYCEGQTKYRSVPLSKVSFSKASVIHSHPQSENIKWKITEVNNS